MEIIGDKNIKLKYEVCGAQYLKWGVGGQEKLIQSLRPGTRRMVQQLGALAEDPGSGPSIHTAVLSHLLLGGSFLYSPISRTSSTLLTESKLSSCSQASESSSYPASSDVKREDAAIHCLN